VRKIAEVLRLKWACRLTNREIARSCAISHSTVSEYVKRAEAVGIKWPIPEALTEDELYRLLFPEKAKAAELAVKPLPDWEKVRKELKKRNVTLRLLWDECETRSWLGWHHHMLLVSLAHHFLVRLRIKFKDQAPALSIDQVKLLLISVLPKPVFDAAAALRMVQYYQKRNYVACDCHRKNQVGSTCRIYFFQCCAVILMGEIYHS